MRKQTRRSPKVVVTPTLRRHNSAAAGLDIGAAEIWACVPAGRDLAVGAGLWHLHARLARVGGLVGAV